VVGLAIAEQRAGGKQEAHYVTTLPGPGVSRVVGCLKRRLLGQILKKYEVSLAPDHRIGSALRRSSVKRELGYGGICPGSDGSSLRRVLKTE